jgi:O-antigen ligase
VVDKQGGLEIHYIMNQKVAIIKNITYKISFFALILTLLSISFYANLSLYILGLLIGLGLFTWLFDYDRNFEVFKNYFFFIFPPVLYFLMHLISSIIYDAPIYIIIRRLIFILLPVLVLPVFIYIVKKNHLAFLSFITGIISIAAFLIIYIIYRAIHDYSGDTKLLLWFKNNLFHYTSTSFSIFEHPSYLSMKIVWAMLLTVYFFYAKINKLILAIIFVLLSVTIFLLASKAGIIMWLILLLSFLIIFIGRKISSTLFKYFTIVVISVTLIAVSFEIVKEIARINFFINHIKTGISQENVDWKNLDQRTREWYCSFQLIKEKPIFGHGIGRTEDRMVEEYFKNGWEEEGRLRLNAHNQFLETQMTFGIPGTLSLLWMLLTPLIFRKRLQYPDLATAFVLMMTFFLMFESMFVRQWGIMFFTLFYCLLVLPPSNKNS